MGSIPSLGAIFLVLNLGGLVSFQMIPCIYAGDLPFDVEDELREWNDELCFHGDAGCVFRISESDLDSLPKFIEWLLSIKAISMQDTDLVEFSTWCYRNNREITPEAYKKYILHRDRGDYRQYITIAMTGT